MNKLIANFYNKLGSNYYDNWYKIENGMRLIREFEADFVRNIINGFKRSNDQKLAVLDIGSGPGRVAEIILKDKQLKYQGIDISSEMIKVLNKKFQKRNNFINAKIGDISAGLPYESNSFDIITCIRVLKYNKNWPEIIKSIHEILKTRGLFLFSIPNKHSLNFFSKGKLPIYKTTINQIVSILQETGFEKIKIEKSSKLSDLLYCKTNNEYLLRLYSFIEKMLSQIFKERFSRLLYVSCYKK